MRNLYLRSNSSNNVISKSTKTSIKRKSRFDMNQSRNRSTQCLKILDNEATRKLSEAIRKE